ncbi:MAG: phospholipase D-like domain-containing protein [Clostridia bacterium]|nr:phospholipase D-like domain-containing protein [Clostridia bacterium]
MVNTLKECFNDARIKVAHIATGYWDIPGTKLLENDIKTFLEREGTRMELLIGRDPYVYADQLEKRKFKSPKYPDDFIRTDISELDISSEYISTIRLLLDYCTDSESSKIQIKVFRKNENDETQFLHSKCYIFEGKEPERWTGYGIVGSSNFTKKGLQGNAELNYIEDNATIILSETPIPNKKSHIQWFKEKWELAEPWNKEFLEQVLEPTPIAQKVKEEKDDFTPYELYIKLLQIKFGDIVDKNISEQIESYLPNNISRLDYQIDAVKRCISIMHEHGGFMLADVVGLGKTIVGTLIIKRFLSVPENDGHENKVLIITPPAIKSGWQKTVEMFDKDSKEKISPVIDFITTGCIGKLTDEEELVDDDDSRDSGDFSETLQNKNYGLIIIDESHKFRNSGTQMYKALDSLISTIWQKTGVYPYIGLLSATPQNNKPNDLKNQIYLFERNHIDSSLKKAESGNIEKFFSQIGAEYDLLISKNCSIPEPERKKRLAIVSQKIRDCILSDILERRTRTDVEKYYRQDMEAKGLVFPKIVGPQDLAYIMDDELAKLFYDTMMIIAPTPEDKLKTDEYLKYYRYRAIEYLSDTKNEEKYRGRGNRGVNDVANQLAIIMQILLVKRLESSFSAFKQSLLNLRRYTDNMIKMWENDTIFICPQIDINTELNTQAKSEKRGRLVSFDECVNDIRAKILKLTENGKNEKGQNAEYTKADFRKEYYDLLKEDLRLISSLCDRWGQNSEDPKLDTFKENLRPVLFDPDHNTSGKLVIFTEAIDTVKTLKRAVEAKKLRVLDVTAASRDQLEHTIEENFDANYAGEWKDDYDVLITTEVLAEGVNLHRANVILNYDTPWNSTRLMQRIGRVNRIGSREPFIYVYNFMPSAQGDAQIQLVRRAYTKLQSFHILFGEDNKVFTNDEEIVQYNIVKENDDEETPMQKYIYELKQYKEAHSCRYAKIEQTDDGWLMAVNENGTAYFVVKSKRGARLTIRIKNEEPRPAIISDIDALEDMRISEETKRVPLPDNWEQLSESATLAYNQYFVRVNRIRANDKVDEATDFIVTLYNSPQISQKSRWLLNRARNLIDRGNYDIITRILALKKSLAEHQLFVLSQEEIDEIIERELRKIVERVENNQGKAFIILGIIK